MFDGCFCVVDSFWLGILTKLFYHVKLQNGDYEYFNFLWYETSKWKIRFLKHINKHINRSRENK